MNTHDSSVDVWGVRRGETDLTRSGSFRRGNTVLIAGVARCGTGHSRSAAPSPLSGVYIYAAVAFAPRCRCCARLGVRIVVSSTRQDVCPPMNMSQ